MKKTLSIFRRVGIVVSITRIKMTSSVLNLRNICSIGSSPRTLRGLPIGRGTCLYTQNVSKLNSAFSFTCVIEGRMGSTLYKQFFNALDYQIREMKDDVMFPEL